MLPTPSIATAPSEPTATNRAVNAESLLVLGNDTTPPPVAVGCTGLGAGVTGGSVVAGTTEVATHVPSSPGFVIVTENVVPLLFVTEPDVELPLWPFSLLLTVPDATT